MVGDELVVPSERIIDGILHRQGLLRSHPRKRPTESYVRFERPGRMQLWTDGHRQREPSTLI
jgi:hypothetical protein